MKRSNILKIVRNVVCIILVTFCCIYYVESYLASMGSHGIFAKILNIKTEEEKEIEESKKVEELKEEYSKVHTIDQAVALYDCSKFEELFWKKSKYGYPYPPIELCYKGAVENKQYAEYLYPYKSKGKLCFVVYTYDTLTGECVGEIRYVHSYTNREKDKKSRYNKADYFDPYKPEEFVHDMEFQLLVLSGSGTVSEALLYLNLGEAWVDSIGK